MSNSGESLSEPNLTISDPAVMTSRAGESDDTASSVKADDEASMSWLEWWRSDWGPGPLISLALPLVMSTGFTSLTLFTDRTLLFYWEHEHAAAAAMGSSTLYWALMCLPTGMLGYLSTFVSQYVGAGRPDRIVVAYRHALRLAWMIVPFLLLALAFAHLPFSIFQHEPVLQKLESTYLRTLIFGGLAVVFYTAQSGLMTGLGYTRWVLLIDGIATAVNLVLAYLLIFGIGPLPALGVTGAGLATAFSFWLKLPLANWLIGTRPELRAAAWSPERTPWEPDMLRRLVLFGAPAGLTMLAESTSFVIITLQVGQLGGLSYTATTLALGLNVLAFVPMLGLGIGVGVLVGRHVLERRIDLASRTVTCAVWLSIIYTSVFAVSLGIFPETMTRVYAMGSDSSFQELRPMLLPLLRIIAVYCVFDGLQIVFVGAIKGAGDTWFVLIATAVMGFGIVGLGMIFQQMLGNSLLLWWYIIALWVFLMAIAFAGRYFQGKWKTMQVIEHTPPQ